MKNKEFTSYPVNPPHTPPWCYSWWHRCNRTSSHSHLAPCSEPRGSSGLSAVAACPDPSPWSDDSRCSSDYTFLQMHGTEHSLCQKIGNVHLCFVSNMVKSAIPSKYEDSFLTVKYILAFTFFKKKTHYPLKCKWQRLTCARGRRQGRWDRSRRLGPGIWHQSICRFHIHTSHDRYIPARSWQGRWKYPWSSRRRYLCSWRHICTSCTHIGHVLVRHRCRQLLHLNSVQHTDHFVTSSSPPQSLLLDRSQLKLSHSQNRPL